MRYVVWLLSAIETFLFVAVSRQTKRSSLYSLLHALCGSTQYSALLTQYCMWSAIVCMCLRLSIFFLSLRPLRLCGEIPSLNLRFSFETLCAMLFALCCSLVCVGLRLRALIRLSSAMETFLFVVVSRQTKQVVVCDSLCESAAKYPFSVLCDLCVSAVNLCLRKSA